MRITMRRTLKVLNLVLSIGANAVTIGIPLLGLLLGIFHLPQGYGLLSKPVPVLTLMYIGIWLGWIWIGSSLLKVVMRRSANKPGVSNFETIMYVVTMPIAVLWILAWGELLGWPKSGPGSSSTDADLAGMLIIFGGGALFFGGAVVVHLVLAIDKFFNPTEYADEPE
jgi:hypothetical protein